MQTLKTHFVLDSGLEGLCGLTAKPRPGFLGKERSDEKGPLQLPPSAVLRLRDRPFSIWWLPNIWSVSLQERKEKLSSCNLLLSGQLNRFQGPSSCLYILWIIGDEKKNVFVVSAPASPTFHRKSRRDPWIIVGIRFNSSLSTQASDCT